MIAAFAPATVSNVAAGFDVLGFALDEPGDVVVARLARRRPASSSARSPATAAACRAIRRRTPPAWPRRRCWRRSAPGTASRSTSTRACRWPAASAAAAPAPWRRWWRSTSCSAARRRSNWCCQAAWQGEQAGCGAAHADNVAPSLYGGFVLARSVEPPDIVRLPVPAGLSCAVLHPHLEVQTGTARALLGDTVPLATRSGSGRTSARSSSALHPGDLALLSRSLEDHVAEPSAPLLVPGFAPGQGRGAGRRRARLQPVGIGPVDLRAGADARGGARRRRGDGRAPMRPIRGAGADLWVSPVGTTGARIVPSREAVMPFISTRGAAGAPVSFAEALLRGLAPDGGLYVPTVDPAMRRPSSRAARPAARPSGRRPARAARGRHLRPRRLRRA